MSTQMQLRGGTTAETALFTGAQREVTVDTDKNTLVVQDGVTPGGHPLATEEALSDGTFYYSDDTGGGSAADAYILVPKPNTNVPNAYLDGILFGFTTSNANTGPSTANFQGLGVKSIKYRGGADPAPGDISGRVNLVYDATNDWLELQPKPTGIPPQLRTIGASVNANALTVTLSPCIIDFRSSALTAGTVITRTIGSTISLTIPSGATLGTQSGIASQLAIIAIDNAGTVELAVINLANLTTLNESGLISTTAISAAASSASAFYSASARLNVPYRVVGMVESTQAAAGTWATPPSRIQGQGGQAQFGNASGTIYSGTAQATTSGTAIDFTGLPSGIKRLTLMLNLVSTTGGSPVILQLGTSSGVETTGYESSAAVINGSATATSKITNGIAVEPTNSTTINASTVRQGSIVLTQISGNNWVANGVFGLSSASGPTCLCGGGKSLSGALDRVRLTTAGGTETFDAGTVNIVWEL